MSLWWVLAGLLCFVIVAIFMSNTFFSTSTADKMEAPKRNKVEADFADIPIAEFVANSAEILPEVGALLEAAEEAEGAEFFKFVRGGEESMERRKAWLGRDLKPARGYPKIRRQLHAAAVGKSAYLILAGLDSDYLAAVAYFIEEDGEFKYDWEASEGYSEVLPTEAKDLIEGEPKLMRAILTPAQFYTDLFLEKEYQAWALHHQDPGEFVWAYAKRSSKANQKLMLSYEAPDLGGTEHRVTVKVQRGPEGARANQVEVVEFIHTDWFTTVKTPEP